MPDHYTYSDSETLLNKLDIDDPEELKRKEDALYFINLKRAYNTAISTDKINLSTLNKIHEQLFADLYGWAGKPRICELFKGEIRFCHHEYIKDEADKIFTKLHKENYYVVLDKDTYIQKLVELYGNLNMLHPYREGNGRALKILFQGITYKASYEVDWTIVTKSEHLEAVIATAYGDDNPLQIVFEKALRPASI